MKIILSSLIFLAFFACSSTDDNGNSLDSQLLYGQWYDTSLCNNQNSLLLNTDNTYVRVRSGNTCETNENDTYRYTGNYNLNSNNITFSQLTEEIIEEGTINSVPVEEDATLLHTKITELTETTLIIEFKIRNNISGQETYSYWTLEK